MNNTSRLWKVLGALLVVSFGILLYFGREIYLAAPPDADRGEDDDGQTLFTREDIETGRQVWQSIGGQELGSIWGHGSYVAPGLVGRLAAPRSRRRCSTTGRSATPASAYADARRRRSRRRCRRGSSRRCAPTPTTRPPAWSTVSEDRARGHRGRGRRTTPRSSATTRALDTLRAQYAIPANPIPDAGAAPAMTAFFFWTVVGPRRPNRPGEDDHLHQQLAARAADRQRADRRRSSSGPSSASSCLLAGIGALAWYYAIATHGKEPPPTVPDERPAARRSSPRRR